MHELSIALSIVDIAEEEVKKNNASVVEEIVIDIGMLSNIQVDSLEFLWDQAVKASVLEGAQRKLNLVPGKARCTVCCKEFQMNEIFDACPECHDFLNEIVEGKELKIRSLTLK